MSEAPSPYFADSKLQRAWDSTSLSALMFCPRHYQYAILEGWSGATHDLEFGILLHNALEVYDKAILAGESVDEAQYLALVNATEESWKGDEPWGGRFEKQWRCTGTEKYKNEKGNAAKCPYSHKGKWFFSDAPAICGECGSDVEVADNWIPTDAAKDRLGLVRSVVWWVEEHRGGAMLPYAFDDGTPAVELSFKIPLPFDYKGDPYFLCGHLDNIMTMGEEFFISDHKTTKKTLGKQFFDGYAPNVQTDTYDLAASLLFTSLDIRGLVIDGIQLLSDGAKFGRQIYYRSEEQREEWFHDLEFWIRQAERYAEDDYWPTNRRSCWLCQYKGVCSKPEGMRQGVLESEFEKRHWNPLEER